MSNSTSALTASPTAVQEHDAIASTIQMYLDGGKSGRGSDMRPAFHEQATIFGYVGPDLFAGPIQGLFDWIDQNGPAKAMQARIASIDVVGTVATTRIEIDDWNGHRFTDIFTMLKIDGVWKIMNKVFHLHAE